MRPALREYIVSEKFIWDELLERAAVAVKSAREMWQRKRSLPSMIISWPADVIHDDKGKAINDTVSLNVPDEIQLSKAIKDMTARTDPYALLVVDTRKADVIKIYLESHHGARTWTLPIRRHGDVNVLEDGGFKDNEECLGVLWRKRVGSG